MSLSFECVPIAEVALPPDADEYRPIVLVVDDEILIADTLSIILSNSGFAPITAYGAESALEIAKVIPPDLLLSDVAMPGMTGVELAIAMTQMIGNCRVLLVSGQSAIMDILAEGRNAGYNFPLLTKPIHPSLLLARIARCFQESPLVTAPICNSIRQVEEILFASR